MERSVRVVHWVRRQAVETPCPAERGLVLLGVGGELFVVQEWSRYGFAYSTSGKRLFGSIIPLIEVSSVVGAGWVGISIFAEDDEAVDESGHCGGWNRFG